MILVFPADDQCLVNRCRLHKYHTNNHRCSICRKKGHGKTECGTSKESLLLIMAIVQKKYRNRNLENKYLVRYGDMGTTYIIRKIDNKYNVMTICNQDWAYNWPLMHYYRIFTRDCKEMK